MTKQEERRGMLRLALLGCLALTAAGFALWFSDSSSPETVASPQGVQVPSDPWQMPGYKRGLQARIWVDPETKCHYYVTGGTWAWNLVPRYDADGASLICNQPVPKEAQ